MKEISQNNVNLVSEIQLEIDDIDSFEYETSANGKYELNDIVSMMNKIIYSYDSKSKNCSLRTSKDSIQVDPKVIRRFSNNDVGSDFQSNNNN